MNRIEVKASIETAYQDRIAEVAEALRRAGMEIHHQFAWGVLIGECDESQISELAKVPGVARVEPTGTFRAI